MINDQLPSEESVNNFSVQPQPVSKIKKLIPTIVVVVLLALAGGVAVYAYYSGVFVSLPDLLSKAIDNGKAIKSASYDVALNVDFSGIKNMTSELNPLYSFGANFREINIAMKGASSIWDPKNLKGFLTMSFDAGSVAMKAELRATDNVLYMAVTKIPTLGILPMPPLYASYENKWFSIPYEYENGKLKDPFASLYQYQEKSELDNSFQLTDEQKDHLLKIFQDAHILKTVKKLTPETVDGEPSYHFLFDLDKIAIISYLQSLQDYMNNSVYKDKYKFPEFKPDEISKGLEVIKDFKGEIWIGKNDKLVHKVSVNFGIQPDIKKDEQAKANIMIVLSGYNQPVLVVAPAESTPFQTLIDASLKSVHSEGIKAK